MGSDLVRRQRRRRQTMAKDIPSLLQGVRFRPTSVEAVNAKWVLLTLCVFLSDLHAIELRAQAAVVSIVVTAMDKARKLLGMLLSDIVMIKVRKSETFAWWQFLKIVNCCIRLRQRRVGVAIGIGWQREFHCLTWYGKARRHFRRSDDERFLMALES